MKHNYELYSYQIACIDTLEKRKLITKKEHEKFTKHIQKQYGIVSGLYPFGQVLSIGETGKRTFQILRTDYEDWKNRTVFCSGQPASTKGDAGPAAPGWELLSTRTYTQEDKDIMWEVIIRSWTKRPQSVDK